MGKDCLPRISVIIVSYNSARYLDMVLQATFEQDYPDYEVILLDNASTDESVEIASRYTSQGLRLVRSPHNRGFSGGNNDAVQASHGQIVFLVNPDAVMYSGCLQEVARAFRDIPDLGVLGAKLLAPDGKTVVHYGGQIDLPAHCRLLGYGEPDGESWSKPMEVEFVVGAALAVPRALWDELGGFDEDFNPAYYEDTDLCVRARRRGRRVMVWPGAVLTHWENHCGEVSASRVPTRRYWWMHHTSRLWFTVKLFSPAGLLFRALPAEASWLLSPHSKGLRRFMLRVYWFTLKKYVRRRILRVGGLAR